MLAFLVLPIRPLGSIALIERAILFIFQNMSRNGDFLASLFDEASNSSVFSCDEGETLYLLTKSRPTTY